MKNLLKQNLFHTSNAFFNYKRIDHKDFKKITKKFRGIYGNIFYK